MYDYPEERGRRILRSFGFVQEHEKDHCWAHPIDGLVAYVDITTRSVDRIIDAEALPAAGVVGQLRRPRGARPAAATPCSPIAITQPEGRSFTIEGNRVRWGKWDLRIGFNEREGLTLHQVAFDGRPVVYRASVAEMVVPYADPSPVRFWQNYFDNGEYMLARGADSLQLGCDCLGDIAYLDAVIADDLGAPKTIQNAICVHEEDFGVLWKHSDLFTGSAETRRQRRMVFSYFTPGRQLRLRLLLVPLPRRHDPARGARPPASSSRRAGGTDYASPIAPGPHRPLPPAPVLGAAGHDRRRGAQRRRGGRGAAGADGAGQPVRQRVHPGPHPADAGVGGAPRADGSVGARLARDQPGGVQRGRAPRRLRAAARGEARAAGRPGVLDPRARRRSPPTTCGSPRYDPAERYPAGDFVNQHPGGAGLPAWTAADRPIDGEDIVVWHTFGTTHFPRPEDWPVMPVDHVGFTLKPVGFFDRNPTLDVPPSCRALRLSGVPSGCARRAGRSARGLRGAVGRGRAAGGAPVRAGRRVPVRTGPVRGAPTGADADPPGVDWFHRVNMQIVTMPVPAQDGITRDNVTVKVDAVVYFKVVDPVRVVVDVQDYRAAVGQVAQTSLRSIIGKSDLDDLLSNRERLNQGLELMIDSPALGWGVAIDRVEIKDVALPETMKRSMSRQAEAERERRARVISADGELQASAKLAQAAEAMSRASRRAAAAAAGDRRAGGVGEELDAGAAVPGGAAALPGGEHGPRRRGSGRGRSAGPGGGCPRAVGGRGARAARGRPGSGRAVSPEDRAAPAAG